MSTNFRTGSVFLPTSNPLPSPRVSYESPINKQNEDDEDDNSKILQRNNSKRKGSIIRKRKDQQSNPSNNASSNNLHNHSSAINLNDISAINEGGDSFFITRGPQIQFPSVNGKKQNSKISNVDTALESKKVELQKVQQMLDQKRKEYEANDTKWKDQELELTRRRQELDNSQKDIKQFNQINESKIDKYYKKVKEEQNQNEEKMKQIVRLSKTIIQLTEEKKKKEEELKKIHLFQNYLNIVARHDNNTFEDDMDKILKRYEILHESIIDLENQKENFKQLIKQTQSEFKTYQKQAQNRLYELNVENQQKRLLLEKLKTKSYNLESAYLQQDLANRKLSQLYSQVIMSITNLHQRCMETRKFKPTEQPKFITDRLEKNISEEYKHLQAIQNRIQDVEIIVHSIKGTNGNHHHRSSGGNGGGNSGGNSGNNNNNGGGVNSSTHE